MASVGARLAEAGGGKARRSHGSQRDDRDPLALCLEKFLQAHEDLVVSAVPLDADHVLQFAQLSKHLLQAVIGRDTEPDTALHAGADGHAQDAFDIESPACEQAADVGHHPWMIVHREFQHYLWALSAL